MELVDINGEDLEQELIDIVRALNSLLARNHRAKLLRQEQEDDGA